jgi:calpain-15
MNNEMSKNDMNLEEQIEHRELAPGVILYKEYKKDHENKDSVGLFIWKVEITTMSVVDFEVHLDQSENIELAGKSPTDELKTVNRIEPFQRVEVARVILKNNWKLKSKFKLTLNIPDKDTQMECIREDKKSLDDEIRRNFHILNKIPTEILTKEEIEAILEREKIKFVDLDFLPNDDAMVNSIYGENLKDLFEYVVHWRRPEDFILSENPEVELAEIKVFNEFEPDPNDIQQGILPDNHLVSALSALAEKCNLIKRLFKSEYYSKYGFYQVKLCINGEWVTICVDDLFPCIPKSNPLVSRSPGSELWVLILEKALAKIYESYYTLVTINISEYLMLLSGCPTVYLDLREMVKFEGAESLLKKIKQFVVDRKYLSVAISKNENEYNNNEMNIDDDESLTVPNFGYTILDVRTKYKDDIIILRKVWYDQKKEEKIKKYEEELIRNNPSHKSDMNEGTFILSNFYFY